MRNNLETIQKNIAIQGRSESFLNEIFKMNCFIDMFKYRK